MPLDDCVTQGDNQLDLEGRGASPRGSVFPWRSRGQAGHTSNPHLADGTPCAISVDISVCCLFTPTVFKNYYIRSNESRARHRGAPRILDG